MKIQLISDTHFEFHMDRGRKFIDDFRCLGDVLVIAGDMCQVFDGLNTWSYTMLRFLDMFKHVVYVPGNHEYFESSFKDVGEFLQSFARGRDNLSILLNRRKIIEGVPFVGTTLWYGPETGGFLLNEMRNIGDHQMIHAMNMLGKQFLASNIEEGDVVITHHLPAHGSIAHRFIGDPLNEFFMSDCEDIIRARRPKLWLHGHTHVACDHTVCDTRIVCNPHGYPSENSHGFDPQLVIEV